MLKAILHKPWSVLGISSFCLLVLVYALGDTSEPKWKVLTEGEHSHTIPLQSLTFFDSANGIGITPLTVEKTNDGGKTWATILDYSDRGLYSLLFRDKKNGWIVGTERKSLKPEENQSAGPLSHKPLLLKTSDSGSNWREVNIDESALTSEDARFSAFFGICFDKSGRSWIVGDGGIVEAKVENETLKVLDVIYTEDTLHSVSCTESGDIWAAGDMGLVMRFQNGWIKKSLNKDAFFMKAKVIDTNIWLIGGVRSQEETQVKGLLLRSHDNGQTWEDKTPALTKGLFDLYLDENQGWLVGEAGTILYTGDGGQTWQREKSPTEGDLINLFFFNSRHGWISGDRHTVLKLD
jgi:photosystem II stability/assembly factor-like uncharacterized protein